MGAALDAAAPALEDDERTSGDDLPPPLDEEAVPSPIAALARRRRSRPRPRGGRQPGRGGEVGRAEPALPGPRAQLEEEVARLKAQLDDARRQPAAGGAFSREREFLNLREVINKKEKEILELRESSAPSATPRSSSSAKTIRELEQERADLDEKNVELEREMLDAERAAGRPEHERNSLAEQKSSRPTSPGGGARRARAASRRLGASAPRGARSASRWRASRPAPSRSRSRAGGGARRRPRRPCASSTAATCAR